MKIPGFEVAVLVKATVQSVNISYFYNNVKPFIVNFSNVLLFPEDISDDDQQFARITLNIGGTSKWPNVSLKSRTRVDFLNKLGDLTMPSGDDYATDGGSIAALESAIKTFYDSSETTNRVIVLLTDQVFISDADSDIAEKLRSICNMIVVVGIPSFQHPSFNDSIDAAGDLVGPNVPDTLVYPSITDAVTSTLPVKTLLQIQMTLPEITCRRIAFLYEDSDFVSLETQENFASAVQIASSYMHKDEVVALVSFDDFLENGLVFLYSSLVKNWTVEAASSYDPLGDDYKTNIFEKLLKIAKTQHYQYLDVVLLTQSDVYSTSLNESAYNLANRENVNVFIFDASQNHTDFAIFDILTRNQRDSIFNVTDANITAMTDILTDDVLPKILQQSCGAVVSPGPEKSTTTVQTTAEAKTTTTLPIVTTPNSANAITVSMILDLIFILLV
uniref:VWFA domain-containing protein n=1 Tax=Panagrellus redivivus TaxID=6233 RepID=A0A7E4ZUY2_PANRE